MIPKPVDGPEPIMRLSTPLTIVGVFVEILRQRFKAGASIDPELPGHGPMIRTQHSFSSKAGGMKTWKRGTYARESG
jgi:hypothetical protein